MGQFIAESEKWEPAILVSYTPSIFNYKGSNSHISSQLEFQMVWHMSKVPQYHVLSYFWQGGRIPPGLVVFVNNNCPDTLVEVFTSLEFIELSLICMYITEDWYNNTCDNLCLHDYIKGMPTKQKPSSYLRIKLYKLSGSWLCDGISFEKRDILVPNWST